MGRLGTGLVLVAALAGGCTPAVPRPGVTFAVLAGSYYSAQGDAAVEAAVVEDSERLLERAVADVNARQRVDFVLVAGDLLAWAEPLSLDRARAMLDELRVPYYVVLGEHDGPAPPSRTGAGPEEAEPAGGPARLPAGAGASRSTVLWTFQGHGISGPKGYWVRQVPPGIVVVGLDTVNPGRDAGHVDARQLAWLDETLSQHQGQMVVVVAHHGLVPLHPLDEGAAWEHLLVDNAGEVRAVLERHPNVVMVVTAHHHFAGGRIAGRIVYLASPSISVWPMAYHLVRINQQKAEAVWVPLAPPAVARQGQERLLGSERYRGVFPKGEDGDTACVRLFGGNKMTVYRLPTIRP